MRIRKPKRVTPSCEPKKVNGIFSPKYAGMYESTINGDEAQKARAVPNYNENKSSDERKENQFVMILW